MRDINYTDLPDGAFDFEFTDFATARLQKIRMVDGRAHLYERINSVWRWARPAAPDDIRRLLLVFKGQAK